jgi:Lysozyme like domain
VRRSTAQWLVPLVVLVLLASTRKRAAAAPVNSSAQRLTLPALRELAVRVGFPDPDTAAAVAMAESQGNVLAAGDSGQSLGLWQVNTPSHPEFEPGRLLEAAYNARAALLISKTGTDWTPWTQFRNGAFRAYMPPAGNP